ncbi:Uma2 family endonuclease [Nocardia inohanensis]|uniref:Uma2 family endonuclease n=1 Tax=Nocardia inohanensis TaxID=209246 RepID=UPI00082D5BD4|nr:Uma2 family endonuclease [Nocardia inohanensis]
MTAMADRPQMPVEDFEKLAQLAQQAGEGIRLEFINGKLGAKPVPDGDHAEIVQWLMRQFFQHRPDLSVYPGTELKVETYRGGRAIPDAVVAPQRSFAGQPLWKNPDPVLMVVEVTSFDSDTDRRDRVEKPRAYAATGIPVYLLIDRDPCEVLVYSRPVHEMYSSCVRLPFGDPVELPDPVGVVLDTESLKDLAG